MPTNKALPELLTIMTRSLWPSHGARSNAAEALADVRRARQERPSAASVVPGSARDRR